MASRNVSVSKHSRTRIGTNRPSPGPIAATPCPGRAWRPNRASYVTANAAARQYRIQLLNYAVAVQRGRVRDREGDDAETIRQAYVAQITDIQRTGSPEVLAELESVSTTLSSALRRIRCVEDGVPEPNDGIDRFTGTCWRPWNGWWVNTQCGRGSPFPEERDGAKRR
ncbi:hypothetical protein ACIRL2_43845 [Embleya sp. NPDC127516]|uniref:hypothetical protein n=1 Tax=Embleya sp. NPDC127516 TaxID=3363990 RepID=UPI003815E1B9